MFCASVMRTHFGVKEFFSFSCFHKRRPTLDLETFSLDFYAQRSVESVGADKCFHSEYSGNTLAKPALFLMVLCQSKWWMKEAFAEQLQCIK